MQFHTHSWGVHFTDVLPLTPFLEISDTKYADQEFIVVFVLLYRTCKFICLFRQDGFCHLQIFLQYLEFPEYSIYIEHKYLQQTLRNMVHYSETVHKISIFSGDVSFSFTFSSSSLFLPVSYLYIFVLVYP